VLSFFVGPSGDALVEAPVWVFIELEPTAQILAPADGSRSHASLGLNLNAGVLPLVNGGPRSQEIGQKAA
jgi:hypothetical protein